MKPRAVLRPLVAADLPAALALTQSQRWSHQMHDWQLHFDLGQGLGACDTDGTLLGAALWWAQGERCATIGLVVVRPDCQGRGIGRQLMGAVLARTGERPVGLIATAAGLRLYEECGFVRLGEILQCQGAVQPAHPMSTSPARPTTPATPTAEARIRAFDPTDRRALFALDAAAFGAQRDALLDAVLGAGQPAWVAERERRLVGFALQRPAGHGVTVGPMVAPDEATAIALATQALATIEGPARFDIPATAGMLAAALAARGLPVVDRVTRMVRGEWPAVDPGARLYGLASQALG